MGEDNSQDAMFPLSNESIEGNQKNTELQICVDKMNKEYRKIPISIASYHLSNNSQYRISCASFSNDGSLLCAGCNDSTIQVYHLNPSHGNEYDRSSEDKVVSSLKGHSGTIFSTLVFQDGVHILSASKDRSILLWNVNSNDPLVKYKGHQNAVWKVAAASAQNGLFCSASLDRTVRLWNTEFTYP